MLRSWKTGVVLLFAAVGSVLSAQGGRPAFGIESCKFRKVDFVPPPVIKVAANQGIDIPAVSQPGYWLLVLLEYKPVLASGSDGSKGKKKKTQGTAEWIDQLDLELAISFPAKSGSNYGKKILLTGRQRLWKVWADGKSHYALFLVPPQIFAQYSNVLLTRDGRKFFTQSAKEGKNGVASSMNLMVTFKIDLSVLKTEAYQAFAANVTGQSVKRMIWDEISGMKKERAVLKVDGGILPKEKSPWEWVGAEMFDLPVPDAGGAK